MVELVLRFARAEEADALNTLCLRSKAYWGYSDEFIDECRDALVVKSAWIKEGRVTVAEIKGERAGVLVVLPAHQDTAEVELLFVEPKHMRQGVGRALMARAISQAREMGAEHLLILSDPNARAFYEAHGAKLLRMAPSGVIEGRNLPLLQIPL